MAIDKINPFSAAQAGAQGIQAIPGRTYQPVNGVTAVGAGSNFSENLGKMNNNLEGGSFASNQYAGQVNGKDNFTANKLNLMA